jgi:hypothetical protein
VLDAANDVNGTAILSSSGSSGSAEALAEEAFGDEESAEQDEGHRGDLLGSLAELFADPGTRGRAEPR